MDTIQTEIFNRVRKPPSRLVITFKTSKQRSRPRRTRKSSNGKRKSESLSVLEAQSIPEPALDQIDIKPSLSSLESGESEGNTWKKKVELFKCPFCLFIYADSAIFINHLTFHKVKKEPETEKENDPPSNADENVNAAKDVSETNVEDNMSDEIEHSPSSLPTSNEDLQVHVPAAPCETSISNQDQDIPSSHPLEPVNDSSNENDKNTVENNEISEENLYTETQTSEGKRYGCAECSKLFKHLGTFLTHFRLHTGENPHQCGWCPLCFLKTSHLQKHIRQTHVSFKKKYPQRKL